ncbi:hypothetical protein, partial [Crocosphaera sp. Alani8]|uniref:hypothetical protein n=1 Tax=Crocosphaera sp. Alani8 TaxID=3038952 RepID=UPI00313B6278
MYILVSSPHNHFSIEYRLGLVTKRILANFSVGVLRLAQDNYGGFLLSYLDKVINYTEKSTKFWILSSNYFNKKNGIDANYHKIQGHIRQFIVCYTKSALFNPLIKPFTNR